MKSGVKFVLNFSHVVFQHPYIAAQAELGRIFRRRSAQETFTARRTKLTKAVCRRRKCLR